MSEEFIGFGKNDDTLLNSGDIERYRGKNNQKDRIALVWFYKDDDGNYRMSGGETPKFKSSPYHYAPGMGYIKPQGEYTLEKFGTPKRRVGTFILKYKTDRKGSLLTDDSGDPVLDFDIMEWQFGEDKYRLLAEIHEEFPLTKHDIKVSCTDAQYQKLSFSPCNGDALWQRNEELRNKVLNRVDQLKHSLSLARDVSVEEIKDHYGEQSDSVPDDASSDIDYDEISSALE